MASPLVKVSAEEAEKALLAELEEIETQDIDLTTQEGREMYAVRMSEIQAALALMQRVLLKQGLEEGFVEEATKVLGKITELEPSENMFMVPSWFVDVRTGDPAIFVFPTNPSDALGEGVIDDVFTPNGLWYSKTTVYPISAILARVYPLPNFKKGDIVPTPVWQITDCEWTARLNSQALMLYHFDDTFDEGKSISDKIAEVLAHAEEAEADGKTPTTPTTAGKTTKLAAFRKAVEEKYTPEKYFEDIKVTVDSFLCNEVFFLLQTLNVRYVAVFKALVSRIYGEQLLREQTIAAAIQEFLDMRKGFGESVEGSIWDKIPWWFWLIIALIGAVVVIMVVFAGLFGGDGQNAAIVGDLFNKLMFMRG
jgi:hypothetical protein